jgi:hypothetical protein
VGAAFVVCAAIQGCSPATKSVPRSAATTPTTAAPGSAEASTGAVPTTQQPTPKKAGGTPARAPVATTVATVPKAVTESSAVYKLQGIRLPDLVYVGHRTAHSTGALAIADVSNAEHVATLVRTVEGSATHTFWPSPDGDPTRGYRRDLNVDATGVHGLFLAPSIGGDEDCAWDGPILLLLPTRMTAGQTLTSSAKCHSQSTQFVYDEQITVGQPTTGTIDGKQVAAWNVHRVVDSTLTGDRRAKDHEERDEVWSVDGPVLLSMTAHGTVDAEVVTSNEQYDVRLDHTSPPPAG